MDRLDPDRTPTPGRTRPAPPRGPTPTTDTSDTAARDSAPGSTPPDSGTAARPSDRHPDRTHRPDAVPTRPDGYPPHVTPTGPPWDLSPSTPPVGSSQPLEPHAHDGRTPDTDTAATPSRPDRQRTRARTRARKPPPADRGGEAPRPPRAWDRPL